MGIGVVRPLTTLPSAIAPRTAVTAAAPLMACVMAPSPSTPNRVHHLAVDSIGDPSHGACVPRSLPWEPALQPASAGLCSQSCRNDTCDTDFATTHADQLCGTVSVLQTSVVLETDNRPKQANMQLCHCLPTLACSLRRRLDPACHPPLGRHHRPVRTSCTAAAAAAAPSGRAQQQLCLAGVHRSALAPHQPDPQRCCNLQFIPALAPQAPGSCWQVAWVSLAFATATPARRSSNDPGRCAFCPTACWLS